MKPQRLFTGNTLTEENFNNIINQLASLEDRELMVDDLQHFHLAGDDYEKSSVQFTRNDRGEITSYSVNIHEMANRTPFHSEDGLLFENDLIQKADISSDYQVLRKDNGLLITGSQYGITESGKILFNQEHDEREVLVNGLDYTLTKTYFISRDPKTRKINRISMEPVEDTVDLIEQQLHPLSALTQDDVIKVLDKDANEIVGYDGTYNELFLNDFQGHFGGSGEHIQHFTLDFKEPLIMNKFECEVRQFDMEGFFYMDVWASLDKNNWYRLKRLRGVTEDDYVSGKLRYNFDKIGSFRYLRFEDLRNRSNVHNGIIGIRNLRVYGYHPENKDLLTTNKMGLPAVIRRIEGTDMYTNGVVTLSTNSTHNQADTRLAHIYTNHSQDFYFGNTGEWVQWAFEERTEIKRIRFKTRYITDWMFQGSNDGSEFTDLYEHNEKEELGVNKTIVAAIDKPRKFKYYRFVPLNMGFQLDIDGLFILE